MPPVQECLLGCTERYKKMNEDQKKHTRYLTKKYPEKVTIIFECQHKRKKENHHYDYNYPYHIERLCHSCHEDRHPKNRKIPIESKPISTWITTDERKILIEQGKFKNISLAGLLRNAIKLYLKSIPIPRQEEN